MAYAYIYPVFRHMHQYKKSLGQHFLTDEAVVRRIMDAIDEDRFTQVLEVGPGGGALTRHLLNRESVDFKAVELDEDKIRWLEQHLPAISGKLIRGDFLQIPPPFNTPFQLVGNFPYNISTQILFTVLDWRDLVPVVVGMFQKEVAERVASREGSRVYGVLSILVQAFYQVEYLFDVGPACFTPPPKVESAVIRLRRRTDVLSVKSEAAFVRLVKTAFNQRRKMLRNAVRGLFDPDVLQDPLFDKRAEALSVDDFAALSFRMR